MMKVCTPTKANSTILVRLVFALERHKITSYLKMKKDDRLVVILSSNSVRNVSQSSARTRPEL